MPPEHVRLSQVAREQLSTLKRRTGIGHWNELCRWALCRSLAESTPPQEVHIPADSNLEMTWRVFSGNWGDELWALLRMRCHQDGLPLTDDVLTKQFRSHLHRGISYLVGDPSVGDVAGLVGIAATSPNTG